jgi:hypothetical protein
MPRSSAAHHRRPERDVSPTRSRPRLDRFARLEATLALSQHTLDVQFKRMANMKAELDLLKVSNQTTGSHHAQETKPKV